MNLSEAARQQIARFPEIILGNNFDDLLLAPTRQLLCGLLAKEGSRQSNRQSFEYDTRSSRYLLRSNSCGRWHFAGLRYIIVSDVYSRLCKLRLINWRATSAVRCCLSIKHDGRIFCFVIKQLFQEWTLISILVDSTERCEWCLQLVMIDKNQ